MVESVLHPFITPGSGYVEWLEIPVSGCHGCSRQVTARQHIELRRETSTSLRRAASDVVPASCDLFALGCEFRRMKLAAHGGDYAKIHRMKAVAKTYIIFKYRSINTLLPGSHHLTVPRSTSRLSQRHSPWPARPACVKPSVRWYKIPASLTSVAFSGGKSRRTPDSFLSTAYCLMTLYSLFCPHGVKLNNRGDDNFSSAGVMYP